MSAGKSPTVARKLVADVLSPDWTREIWSGNYEMVLPVTLQDFELGSILPAIFYMFRFGHRRGKGQFLETFGGETGSVSERRRAVTIERVAEKLSQGDDFHTEHDEELTTRETSHSARKVETCRFSNDDFSGLVEDSLISAKVVVSVSGNEDVEPQESEEFLICFGSVDPTPITRGPRLS